MRNLWLVMRREYVTRIRSGAYIASTLVMMLLFLGSTLAPVIFEGKTNSEPLPVTLVDKTGLMAAPLREALAAYPRREGEREIHLSEGTDEAALTEQVRTQNSGLLIVEGTFPGALKARYMAGSLNAMKDNGPLIASLQSVVRSARLRERGIDPAVAREILQPMQIEQRQMTGKDEGVNAQELGGAVFLAMGVLMAVYMVVFTNGAFVFNGVLEEKVSRVMEVMAASVRPGEMLAGKVIGLGALGLTQLAFLTLAWAAGNAMTGRITQVSVPAISPGAGALILLYVILGYALSATLMAAAAATISRMEDSQTVLMPITMLQVVPMILIFSVLGEPNGTMATVMSLIPFFSPSVMAVRLVLTDVPAWQTAVSVGLMLLTLAGMVWAGARVYRAAMLSYGSRPSLRQIFGYLRAG